MANRIMLRAATSASIALILIALSISWDTRPALSATSSGLATAHSPMPAHAALVPATRHQLSRAGAFKPGSQAAAHLLAVPMAAHGHRLVIGERAFRADWFIARLLPDTSVAGRAPPLA